MELGARAFEILIALISTPNEVVSKKDLMSRVWPDVTVEEGSLRFHMTSLRKALGDGKDGARYITTLAGRGYCFVAPVSQASRQRDEAPAALVNFRYANLPHRLGRMVGRSDDVQKLSAQLRASRLVTIVGPGGVGKTTVAIAVAHHLAEAFAGSVLFVDLGMLSDPKLANDSNDNRSPDMGLLRVVTRAYEVQRRLAEDTTLTVHDIAHEERVTSDYRLYRTAPALARAGYHHGDRQRPAATTAQCQALDAADCAASGRLVRTKSPARLSLRLVHRLLNCRALLQRAKPPTPNGPQTAMIVPARCQPPNGPVEILTPCSPPRDGPRGSPVRRRCILSPRKPPKRA